MRRPARSRSAHRPAPQRWRRPHRRPAGARWLWQGVPSWLGRRPGVGLAFCGLLGGGKKKRGGVALVSGGGLGDGKRKWRGAARGGAARVKSGARGPPRDARRALPAGAAPVSVPGWRRCYRVAMRVLLKWLLSAVALLFVAYVYSGVEVRSFGAALIAAFVIGLFNVVLRPVLVLLTLPVTIVTLGLFLFVINALMFWAAASLLDGFPVPGFAAALLGSLIYSLLGVLIESALGGLFAQQ